MAFYMNDLEFQVLYTNYKLAQDIKEKNLCIEQVHHYVYRYATKRFKAQADIASDFYSYIYDKIPSFFEEYDQYSEIRFSIFIAVKLKYYYLKFINLETNKTKGIAFEEYKDWNTPLYIYPKQIKQSENEQLVQEALERLPIENQICIRLRFGFLLMLKHLRFLMYQWKTIAFFELYRKYLIKLEHWNEQEREKKENLLSKILHQKNEPPNNLKMKQTYKNRFKNLNLIKEPIKLKEIANMIQRNTSYVYRQINRGLSEIKSFISQNNKVKQYFYEDRTH